MNRNSNDRGCLVFKRFTVFTYEQYYIFLFLNIFSHWTPQYYFITLDDTTCIYTGTVFTVWFWTIDRVAYLRATASVGFRKMHEPPSSSIQRRQRASTRIYVPDIFSKKPRCTPWCFVLFYFPPSVSLLKSDVENNNIFTSPSQSRHRRVYSNELRSASRGEYIIIIINVYV